jgi:uncharacterized protein (DUF1810 family)
VLIVALHSSVVENQILELMLAGGMRVDRSGHDRAIGDAHDLQRFRAAQDDGGVYEDAIAELRAGRKQSHWMWFVFPQVAGLGRSAMARRFAIGSLDEARAYLADPVLGPRLVKSARILVELGESDAQRVLGGIDAMKLRSSMTLFARAAPDESIFRAVLDQYFGGSHDAATEQRLRGRGA